ncbi:MAG: HEAT repeat domain-containing protein [bacterium]
MHQNIKEYRRILGVDENAEIGELRKAFHVRASLFHPDVRRNDPGADAEFKRITTAYHYLKNEILKAKRKNKASDGKSESAGPSKTSRQKAVENETKVTKLPGSPVPLEELVYRLRFSQNRYVRIHAMREMVKHGRKNVLWWVLGSLKDPDSEVRRSAVRALGEIGSAIAVVPLLEMHRRSDSFIRNEIEESLHKIEQNNKVIDKPRPQTAS